TAIGTFKRYDSSGDAWHEHTIDLSDYTGDSIIIAFHAVSAYGNDLHIDDVSVETPADNDVGVTGIIQADFPKVNQSASWGFIVKNFGNQAQSNFWVVFNTKKNTTKDSVQVSSLAAGATDTVYKSWTPSTSGYDTMFAWTNLSNDENHSNDTSDLAFYVLNQDEYLFEDFETGFPPNEWQNVALSGSYTWEWVTSTSHPSGYNPYSGSYMARYNSYDATSGNEARLITDTVDLSGVSVAKLQFYMFHDNDLSSKPDSLIVEIKKRSGGSWPSDWTRLGGFARYDASGDAWHEHLIEFTAGDSVIIAFRAKSGYGNDIYLDRIRLFKPPNNDVGVLSIIAQSEYHTGSQDTLWFEVKNFGAQDQSNFWVVFNGKLNTSKDSVQVSSLAAGAIDTVFKLWTPSNGGRDTIFAWTNLSNDQNHSNDSSQAEVLVYGSGFYLFESFEGTFPPSEWENTAVSGSKAWEKDATANPAAVDGSAKALYPADSVYSEHSARLVTDTIDLTGASSANLQFYMYHDANELEDNDSLVIEVKRRTGGSWPSSWTKADKFIRPSLDDEWKHHTVALSAYVGDSVLVSFHAYSDGGRNIIIDKVEILAAPDTDLAVREIIAPDHFNRTVEDTLKFVVTNFGSTDMSNFYVYFNSKLSGSKLAVTDSVLVSSLAKGVTDTVAKAWTPQNAGTDTITAWVSVSNDASRGNDTTKTAISIWHNNMHIIESFEDQFLPQDWAQDSSGNGIHWQRADRTNYPYGTYPPDGNYLVYFESHSYGSGAWARLITDTIDMTNDSAATVRFQMFHDYNEPDSNDMLVIEVKKRTGGSWPYSWTGVDTVYRYRSTNHWEEHPVDISQYTGDSVIVSFKGVSRYGT
ncbi:MAG: hypothetical protein DRQ10_08895, partial [Candidatus Hydrothermota bacterium]